MSPKKNTKNKFTLYQDIGYNSPGVIDEEFSYTLNLIFLDLATAKTKKKLDLTRDTAIIRSKYGVFSVWNWDDEDNKVSGQIEIITWSKRSVTIKENVFIYDVRRNEKRTFIGTRTFKRRKDW